jgi:hypothetical protein
MTPTSLPRYCMTTDSRQSSTESSGWSRSANDSVCRVPRAPLTSDSLVRQSIAADRRDWCNRTIVDLTLHSLYTLARAVISFLGRHACYKTSSLSFKEYVVACKWSMVTKHNKPDLPLTVKTWLRCQVGVEGLLSKNTQQVLLVHIQYST